MVCLLRMRDNGAPGPCTGYGVGVRHGAGGVLDALLYVGRILKKLELYA
jgi:hypothetical protein